MLSFPVSPHRQFHLTQESLPSLSPTLTRSLTNSVSALELYLAKHRAGHINTLRDGQWQVFESLSRFFERGETRGYIKIPTRVGKAVIIAELVEAIGLEALVLTPRRHLKEDLLDKFRVFAPDLAALDLKAFDRHQLPYHAAVSTYQYMVRNGRKERDAQWKFPLIILDEAHEMMGEERRKLINAISANSLVIGLTATDRYSERRSLVNYLGPEIHQMSIREAVQLSLTSPFVVITAETEVDISDVAVQGAGEQAYYSQTDLQRKINQAKLNQAAVQLHMQEFSDRYEIDFCAGVQHSIDLAATYRAHDIPAEAVTHRDSPRERRQKFEALRSGKIRVLTNDNMLKLGVTFENVSVVQCLVPTLSPVDCEQRGGRAIGLDPNNRDKIAIIVEYLHKDSLRRRQQVTYLDVVNCSYLDRPEYMKTGFSRFTPQFNEVVIGEVRVTMDTQKVMEIHKIRKQKVAEKSHACDTPARELRELVFESQELCLRLPRAAELAHQLALSRLRKLHEKQRDPEEPFYGRSLKRERSLREFLVTATQRIIKRNETDFDRYSREKSETQRFVLFSQQTAEFLKHLERKAGRPLLSQGDYDQLWNLLSRAGVELRDLLNSLNKIVHPLGVTAEGCLRTCERNRIHHPELKQHLSNLSRTKRREIYGEVLKSFEQIRSWEDRYKIRWDVFREVEKSRADLEHKIGEIEKGPLLEMSMGLIAETAREFRGRGIEIEELQSIGHLVLTEKIPEYLRKVNYAFSTFAKAELRMAFEAELKREKKEAIPCLSSSIPEIPSDATFEFSDEGELIDPWGEEESPLLSRTHNASIDPDRVAKAAEIVASLPPLYREYAEIGFGLFTGTSPSYEGIARIFNVPLGTVKSRMTRLRQLLKEAGEESDL